MGIPDYLKEQYKKITREEILRQLFLDHLLRSDEVNIDEDKLYSLSLWKDRVSVGALNARTFVKSSEVECDSNEVEFLKKVHEEVKQIVNKYQTLYELMSAKNEQNERDSLNPTGRESLDEENPLGWDKWAMFNDVQLINEVWNRMEVGMLDIAPPRQVGLHSLGTSIA